MKELYAEYNENGFEIVTISVDDTLDEWKKASINQKLPWLDLGSIGGFSADVPLSYGIFFVPMNYLVDSKGVVIKKNIEPNQLEEFLSVRGKDTL